MKIDLLIKCVKELGYHLGTILGTIWVPLDILGTTGVPFWVPLHDFFCDVKNRFFGIFHIYRYTLGTEWYPMVPKIFSLKIMKSRLYKIVSNVVA